MTHIQHPVHSCSPPTLVTVPSSFLCIAPAMQASIQGASWQWRQFKGTFIFPAWCTNMRLLGLSPPNTALKISPSREWATAQASLQDRQPRHRSKLISTSFGIFPAPYISKTACFSVKVINYKRSAGLPLKPGHLLGLPIAGKANPRLGGLISPEQCRYLRHPLFRPR